MKQHELHIVIGSVRLLAYVIPHAKRIFYTQDYTVTCGLSGCIMFPTLSQTRYDFRKEMYC